jgi:hypothetical protein
MKLCLGRTLRLAAPVIGGACCLLITQFDLRGRPLERLANRSVVDLGTWSLTVPTLMPVEDFAAVARKYARLAEDPDNEEYREQFLDLARVWMEVAMEGEGNRSSSPI